ncbi:multisubunit sodium/proton antiporter, MrpE subunit (TC 2.A.63.1) [Microbulbifer donghaiensis]|uniref:Multisubunit sodium/proton antiporter, MrpE subunit (TC 2.A.63.1) n=1 Tax=Microbulbifer donghaiensis TaxID=494016 RepID=A0A1M4UHK9_9GAMM|nr:Na+/H+ antiporter subunit E [Microbulbifer donghaiensis]SHE56189.1 multisubunit sodium/proton antiporter, MrpE subunit (TC 2.A.63.1) [Microbulbifer donghaiensis]
MRYTLSLIGILAFIWLANSGLYTPLLLTFGLLSIALVLLLARRMQLVDRESQPLHLATALPGYYWWLFRKIVQSNLQVVSCVWRSLFGNRDAAISPIHMRVRTNLRTDLAKVLYANSITLTPGTVAVELDGDEILVHALAADGIEELRRGEMERRVGALEE